MSEDAFFRVLSSTSPQWSPVDFARMSSLAVLHRLGLWLEGFRASASKLNQFCPIATLFRVCLPECSFPWPGPEEAFCILDFCLYRSCLLPLCFIVPWLWLSRLTLWIVWNRACRVLRRSPPRSPSFSARGIGSQLAFRRGGRGRLGCLSAIGVSSSSGPSPSEGFRVWAWTNLSTIATFAVLGGCVFWDPSSHFRCFSRYSSVCFQFHRIFRFSQQGRSLPHSYGIRIYPIRVSPFLSVYTFA